MKPKTVGKGLIIERIISPVVLTALAWFAWLVYESNRAATANSADVSFLLVAYAAIVGLPFLIAYTMYLIVRRRRQTSKLASRVYDIGLILLISLAIFALVFFVAPVLLLIFTS